MRIIATAVQYLLGVVLAMDLDESDKGAIINGEVLSDLRFTDDIALLAENENDLQSTVDRIVEASEYMGMRSNADKTEIKFLRAGDKQFQIKAMGQQLQQTGDFVYLGGRISTENGSEGDIERRIGLARGVLQTLSQIWSANELSKATKVKVYETLVLSVLLYNSETWTLKEEQIRKVTRRDNVRNKEIYNRLHLSRNIVDSIQLRRLRYSGHVCRMGNSRYPTIAMEGYVHGQRRRGRPKKRWMDMVRSDCNNTGLSIQDAMTIAQDRSRWRNVIGGLPLRAPVSPRH
jgi:hypothetical protein